MKPSVLASTSSSAVDPTTALLVLPLPGVVVTAGVKGAAEASTPSPALALSACPAPPTTVVPGAVSSAAATEGWLAATPADSSPESKDTVVVAGSPLTRSVASFVNVSLDAPNPLLLLLSAADPSAAVVSCGSVGWLPGVDTSMSSSVLEPLLAGVGLTVSTPSLILTPLLLLLLPGVAPAPLLLLDPLVPSPAAELLPGPAAADEGPLLAALLVLLLLCRKAAESRRLFREGKLVPLAKLAMLLVL
jgi:hypothetical protein